MSGESRFPEAARQNRRLARVATFMLGALTALAATSAPLFGQHIPSPYRFVESSQEAGVLVSDLTPDTGLFGFGPAGGRMFGGYYEIRVGGPFSLQGGLGLLSTTRDVVDPRREEGDRKIGEADVTLAKTDVRLQFTLTGPRTWYRLAPHLFAGGGAAFDFAPDQEIDEVLEEDDRFSFGPSFLGTVGGGIRWFPVDRVAVRAEGIITYWKVNTPRGYLRTDRVLVEQPEDSDQHRAPDDGFWSVSRGLSFGIGIRF